jgi:DNA-binding transcriptional MerR regulator
MANPLTQITFEFESKDESTTTTEIVSAPTEIETEVMDVNDTITREEEGKPANGKRGRKSLKEIAVTSDLVQVPEDDVLFQKQYYSIGEVAVMFRENQSLIRYWETEFDILQPRKNRKGDRFFRPVDIKNLVMIYDLLRRRKFTIEGAREYLKKDKKAEEKFAMIKSLEKIKAFLLELKASL